MFAAFLTALLWSVGAVSANRGARLIGSLRFNLLRLLLALALLGAYAHTLGGGLSGPWVPWFLLSGVIGFGIGDLAGYGALAALGSRLAVLIIHCAAMPLGALFEWLWLGTRVEADQMLWVALIACGLVLATASAPRTPIAPSAASNAAPVRLSRGVALSFSCAASQAFGAVTSRKAFSVAGEAGAVIDAVTSAYQRCLGGVMVVTAFALLALQRRTGAPPSEWRRVPPWIVIHTLCGPVIGVACFQWALSTTPAGVVLPILATIPLLVTPLAMALEGERPSPRSLAGVAVSVSAACALAAGR